MSRSTMPTLPDRDRPPKRPEQLLRELLLALPKCMHRDRRTTMNCVRPATRGSWCDQHAPAKAPDLPYAVPVRAAQKFLRGDS